MLPRCIGLAHVSLADEEPKKALRHLKAAEEADPRQRSGQTAGCSAVKRTKHSVSERTRSPAYQKAIEKETEDPRRSRRRWSGWRLRPDKRDEALGYLRRLATVAEDDPEFLASAAEGFARLGRFDDALELAGQGERRATGRCRSLPGGPLGLALADRGEAAKARRTIDRPRPGCRHAHGANSRTG